MTDEDIKKNRIMPAIKYFGVLGFNVDKDIRSSIKIFLPKKVFDFYFGGGNCMEFMQIGLMTVTVLRDED